MGSKEMRMSYTQYSICLAELMRGLGIATPTHGYKPEQAFEDGRKIATKIEELEKASQWQPIETAPKDGSTIIVGLGRHRDFPVLIVFYNRLYEIWLHYGEAKLGLEVNATHWMPLPKPPAISDKSE
jgi:hypothetical protein